MVRVEFFDGGERGDRTTREVAGSFDFRGGELAPKLLFFWAMLPFRKVLFPVDFSEACLQIVPRVREKLDRFQAELLLVNAMNPAPLAVGPPEAPLFFPPPDQSELYQQRREQLNQFAADHFPGVKPTCLLALGDANQVINDTLRHQGADLVMMPTHGHGVVRRLLLGSVTAKLLHDADCAVWTMVPHAGQPAQYPYRRILCAMSLDQADSAAVLLAAGAIAHSYGAELSIRHAVDLPEAGLEYAYLEAILAAADAKMRKLRQETGVKAPYQIVTGDPVEQMRLAAVNQPADLILTGRGHAREGTARMWSQLYSLIREAPCPVLSL